MRQPSHAGKRWHADGSHNIRSFGNEPLAAHAAGMLPANWLPCSCLRYQEHASCRRDCTHARGGMRHCRLNAWQHTSAACTYRSFRLSKAPLPPHSVGSVPADMCGEREGPLIRSVGRKHRLGGVNSNCVLPQCNNAPTCQLLVAQYQLLQRPAQHMNGDD